MASRYCRVVDANTMPWSVGIRFTHASLQVLADDHGIDLLHIKGPAVDDSLLEVQPGDASPRGGPVERVARQSIDADVLVRPAHVERLLDVMHRHGWTMKYRFEDGSAFEHAATLMHPFLAPVDVHRRFLAWTRTPPQHSSGSGRNATWCPSRARLPRAVGHRSAARARAPRHTRRAAAALRHRAQLDLRHGRGARGSAAPCG